MQDKKLSRRQLLKHYGAFCAGASFCSPSLATGILSAREHNRPTLSHGIQLGDISTQGAMVWARADRAARMLVEYSYDETFKHSTRVIGPYALAKHDYTGRLDLTRLAANHDVFVKVTFEDLNQSRISSEPVVGHFRTAPQTKRDIHFLWSGDTAGQGWGINPDIGGMRIYDSMRKDKPDFFIHSGDTIYADGPISATAQAENGRPWNNVLTEEVSKVAESLKEFRGRYQYNMLDDNVRAFNAEVPQIWQWDDHEVVNNWSDSKDLSDDDRYQEKNVPLLIARGATAFAEYAPMRPHGADESGRVYRRIPYGPQLDVFVVDMRSYRGPNTENRQTDASPETRFFGEAQLQWLKQALLQSQATWKVIASDMPIGLIVSDGEAFYENMANGDGPPLGRELEMAELLKFIHAQEIENLVWLTADVHYCAAHYYSPEKAVFKDFSPFWEFVAGPLNAGSFGPASLDNTFGPEVIFSKVPSAPNLSPLAGHQFYGAVQIDSESEALTVNLKDWAGRSVYQQTLTPILNKPSA